MHFDTCEDIRTVLDEDYNGMFYNKLSTDLVVMALFFNELSTKKKLDSQPCHADKVVGHAKKWRAVGFVAVLVLSDNKKIE